MGLITNQQYMINYIANNIKIIKWKLKLKFFKWKKCELSKFQICTYIEDFKQEKNDQINCMLTLHDGRFAVGSKDLKIYNNIFFTIDFIVPSKKLKNSPTKKSDDSFFWISILIYLKNENILIRTKRI